MLSLLALLLPLVLVGIAVNSSDDDEGETDQTSEPQTLSDGADLLDVQKDGAPDRTPEPRPDSEPTPAPKDRFDTTPDGRRVFTGTDKGELFLLGGKDDVVFAQGGDDTLVGGGGDDELFMGDGDDRTFPSDGNYRRGSSGPDVLLFNDYSESAGPFQGDFGDDVIRCGGGSDEIKDRQGADRLYGDTGSDILDARDTVDATAAPDSLFGGQGRDMLVADSGDIVSGGEDPDRFLIAQSPSDVGPVIITDYEPDEVIVIELKDASQDDVSLRLAKDEEDTEVVLQDEVILRLTGVTDPDTVQLTYTKELDDIYSSSPLTF